MNKAIGKVIDIYIPEQYNNNALLDVMDRTNITFKIMTNKGLKEITTEQNEENAMIMKNDLVEIIEQTISGQNFVDIRLYGGEDNE
ncbi:MAG: hypothetical protein IJH20_00770 [Bacilli bacterium]|nr:hypothetical protein [Bacilli bacterium]